MKVVILKTTISPGDRRTPNILRKGAVLDLEDDVATQLIDAEKAEKYVESKKQDDPKAAREKELKKLDVAGLDKLLEEKELPVEGKKEEKVAAILATEFPEA